MIGRSVFGLGVVLGALACSKSEGEAAADAGSGALAVSTRKGSCDRITAMSVCADYAGAHLEANEAVVKAACSKLSGTYTGGECPNTSVLGSCTLSTSEVRRYYTSGGSAYDAERAEKECTKSYAGKWAPFR